MPGDFCCGAGVFNFTLLPAAPADGKTSGNFTNGFSLRQFDGTAAHEYRFVNTAGDVYGSNGGSENGIGTTNSGNYLRFYGLDATHPMYCRGNIGAQLPSATIASGGGHFTVQNLVIDACTNSGVTANYGIIGTQYYEDLILKFIRVKDAGQEGICYIGDTGGSYNGTNYINTAFINNNWSYNSSREGTQCEHINVLTANHNTCILSGQTGGGSQNNDLQAHDLGAGSTISYSIYDRAPISFNIFTHGLTISYCYISQTSTTKAFIGRTDNAYFSASTRLTGDSLIFDHVYFKNASGSTMAHLCDVAERTANIIFRNCTFDGYTNIWNDTRVAGFTNTITGNIGDHGNASASIEAPRYKSTAIAAYTTHGLVLNPFYYGLHMGFRTP